MIDANKIKRRLRETYRHVEMYTYPEHEEPVFFACNYDNDTFIIVSVYMDSEIGGYFTLDHEFQMEIIHKFFDAEQAWDLRAGLIEEIDAGNVEIIGNVKPNKLN